MGNIKEYGQWRVLKGYFCAALVETFAVSKVREEDLDAAKKCAELWTENEINNSDLSENDKLKAIDDFKKWSDDVLHGMKLRLRQAGRLL